RAEIRISWRARSPLADSLISRRIRGILKNRQDSHYVKEPTSGHDIFRSLHLQRRGHSKIIAFDLDVHRIGGAAKLIIEGLPSMLVKRRTAIAGDRLRTSQELRPANRDFQKVLIPFSFGHKLAGILLRWLKGYFIQLQHGS